MKTEYRITEIGILLLHPERYSTRAEVEAAIAAMPDADQYQWVKLEYEDPSALIDARNAKRAEKAAAEMTEEQATAELSKAQALIDAIKNRGGN